MKKRVGIFGGSFNPVHNGHRLMVKELLKSRITDEIWILPAPDPPHKTDTRLALFHHRTEMLKLAFDDIENVHIKDVEMGLPKPSYTLQTIHHLEKRYPQTLFFLCMGEDSLEGFTSWYKYRDILDRVSLVVARRPGSDRSNPDMEILRRTIFLENPVVDISSSRIRESGFATGDLPARVGDYIRENSLYIRGQTDK